LNCHINEKQSKQEEVQGQDVSCALIEKKLHVLLHIQTKGIRGVLSTSEYSCAGEGKWWALTQCTGTYVQQHISWEYGKEELQDVY